MKTSLVVHDDLDAVGCVVLARRAFENKELDISYCDYETVDRAVLKCLANKDIQRLFILDISVQSDSVYKRLDGIHREGSLQIVNLDHHASMADKLADHPWALCDSSICGTGLFYDWLIHKNLLPDSAETRRFVNAIDVYDRWILDSSSRERGERLNRLCHFMGFDQFTDTFAIYLDADEDPPMDFIDEVLVEKQKRYVEHVISTQLTDDIIHADSEGRGFVVTYCDRHISQVCAAILGQFPNVVYAVNLDLTRNVGDLRSRKGEVNVSVIAKQLGGNGHPEAAGFPFLLREVLFEEIERKLNDI